MAPLVAPVLDNYAIPPWNLPRYLYFVEHAQSQAYKNNHGDFEAADLSTGLRGPTHVHRLISKHVNWANRDSSPFISTFASETHAVNWARQRLGPARIHEIDTEELYDPDYWVFYARDFTPSCFECEFLFFQAIPGHAIVSTASK